MSPIHLPSPDIACLSRREHHVNSLFLNSRSLSPGTNNLLAMKKVTIDRTDFSPTSNDLLLREEDICGIGPDSQEYEYRREEDSDEILKCFV